MQRLEERTQKQPLFIDAFAGCGGLSLGLLRAGWKGLFCIEKDPLAFATFKANLLERKVVAGFDWPSWLPIEPACINSLIDGRKKELADLRGRVGLLAGGPPCQGFSSAGRRDPQDPRNELMKAYLKLVSITEPAMVLLENVKGITIDFDKPDVSEANVNYADYLRESLGNSYNVFWMMANAAEFGVPQARKRFILVALHHQTGIDTAGVGDHIDRIRRRFLRSHRLVMPTTALTALSDLEVSRNGTIACADSPGFMAIGYLAPRTHYQRLMRDGHGGLPSDTRLARHDPGIVARFSQIIARCSSEGRLNVSLSREAREEYGLKKQALRVLDPHRPAPTITSMPDDLLHYQEPRTLTVRENARLQSFPDWFEFHGKYTTGGHRRRREVPRFTQVANAVPPLMAQVLGEALLDLWEKWNSTTRLAAFSPPHSPGQTDINLIQADVKQHCDISEVEPVLDQVAP